MELLKKYMIQSKEQKRETVTAVSFVWLYPNGVFDRGGSGEALVSSVL